MFLVDHTNTVVLKTVEKSGSSKSDKSDGV